MSENATARPWHIERSWETEIRDSDDRMIAHCDVHAQPNTANAALIVEAVNDHDFLKSRSELFEEMVEAGTDMLTLVDKYQEPHGIEGIQRAAWLSAIALLRFAVTRAKELQCK